MIDLCLTIAHHLLVFATIAVFASELALVREGMGTPAIRSLRTLDAFYGALAALVIVVGFLRVFYGLKVAEFFLLNPLFWGKVSLFVIIGLLSIRPTLTFLAWGRRLASDPAYSPPTREIRTVRRFFAAQAILFLALIASAAAMVRGYGLS